MFGWYHTAKNVAASLGRAAAGLMLAVVAEDVAGGQRRVVRVVVNVRYAPFITLTHGRALAAPSSDVEVIEQAALAALDAFTSRRPVRLLGVRAELEL